jgi:hypothetical protein
VSAALAVGLIGLVSCSGDRRYVFNEQEYVVQGQTLMPTGSGCSNITLPGTDVGGQGVPHIGDFNFIEGAEGDSYVVRVFTDSDLLAERRYSEAAVASGRMDEFSVTTHSGAVHTLRFWGGHACTALDDAGAPDQ